MNPIRTRATALIAAAVAVVTLGASPASACAANQTQFPYVLSTGASAGTADPIGALDTEWQIVGAPPVPLGFAVPGPVFSVVRHPAWIEPRPIANWINPTTVVTSVPVGYYTFRTTFWVPPGMTVQSLAFQYAADNSVALYLNGGYIGGTSSITSFAQWQTLFLPNPRSGRSTRSKPASTTAAVRSASSSPAVRTSACKQPAGPAPSVGVPARAVGARQPATGPAEPLPNRAWTLPRERLTVTHVTRRVCAGSAGACATPDRGACRWASRSGSRGSRSPSAARRSSRTSR